jgi:hypothetical protein
MGGKEEVLAGPLKASRTVLNFSGKEEKLCPEYKGWDSAGWFAKDRVLTI